MSIENAILTATKPAYERALLGAVITGTVDPRDLPIGDSDLYTPRHAALLRACREARDAGVPAEATALAGWLTEMQRAEGCGGLGYVAGLVGESAVSAESAAWYAAELAELARRRTLIEAAERMQQAAEQGATSAALASMATAAATAGSPRDSGRLVDLGEFMDLGLAEIDLRTDRPHGLLTGLEDLDAVLPGGLRGGNVVSIAAPTSQGKTTLGLNIAVDMASRQKASGIFFSLEMSTQECFDKILSAATGIPLPLILTGALSDSDWAEVARVSAWLAQTPLALHEGSVTVDDIRATVRQVRRRRGAVHFIAVDYLQLIKTASRRPNREQELSAIMRDLRRLALDEDVVALLMVQCNRAAGARLDHVPVLSDLRESGEIENSSTHVFMIYNEAFWDRQSTRGGEADIWVRKNRLGPRDIAVPVAAQLHRSRFKSLARPVAAS